MTFADVTDTYIDGTTDGREANEYCPLCDSADTVIAQGLATGIETTYKLCLNCGHQWGHE